MTPRAWDGQTSRTTLRLIVLSVRAACAIQAGGSLCWSPVLEVFEWGGAAFVFEVLGAGKRAVDLCV